ncbi:hypothetical protein RCV08_17700 [Escherichia coli]|uniref:hypothetical protein n=1 Tax=Escherichia coli TaxID=562 RepID=UPI000BEAC5BB|nr:hypothetical protein [Escherichia coli]MED0439195.1 hypothetical protein [Escherichia coli]GCG50330.1 hypothetical protein BvCmsH15A_03649 [Escherichia coli]
MILRNVIVGLILGILAYIASVYIGGRIVGSYSGLSDLYRSSMRGYFFSAFLGISSFLLSLLTFVVINLKEKMFDSEDYKKIYIKHNQLNAGGEIKKYDLYKPLAVITTMLVFSISCSIFTSILQFTLGLSSNCWILIIPTLTPFIAISFMVLSLYQMSQLIFQWLRSEDVIKIP